MLSQVTRSSATRGASALTTQLAKRTVFQQYFFGTQPASVTRALDYEEAETGKSNEPLVAKSYMGLEWLLPTPIPEHVFENPIYVCNSELPSWTPELQAASKLPASKPFPQSHYQVHEN